jgi:cytoplasmic iron level regulating protein YaaA (DUF328/UPF0246 family)
LLILLPPSEGKADAGTGRRLHLDRLSLPALRDARQRVLEALQDLCVLDEPAALKALGLTAGQLDEVRRNTGLLEARTLPAARLYTGVLYDALDLGSLTPDGYRMMKRSIVIFSGLWGAVRLDDRIPPYRCSMTASLPGLGGLGPFWRGVLDGPLTELAGGGVVLDLRSSMYVPAWVPSGPLAERTVAVQVLHDGKVVSHFNKATKGRLVRDLALAGARPRSVRQLVTALRDLKYTVQEHPAAKGRPRRIDVVVSEVVHR